MVRILLQIQDVNNCRYEQTFLIGKNIRNNEQITLFPNPVRDRFHILFDKEYIDVNVNLLNSKGQTISKYTFDKVKQTTLEPNAAKGIYFVQITSAQFTDKIFKLFIE